MIYAADRIANEQLKMHLIHLASQEPMTVQELADEMSLPKRSVVAFVETLFQRKVLVRMSEKVWCAEAGRKVYVYKTNPHQSYAPRIPANTKPISQMTAQEKTQYKKDLDARKSVQREAALEPKKTELPVASVKETVVKVNATTTMYLNSNKPAGWYSWQKVKRNTNTSIASTFSLI
jgi:predicted transcriptional regulator